MNKKVMGICIPYYCNTAQCEDTFKNLMSKLVKQLTDDMILCVYEDGQESDWLKEYKADNIWIKSCKENKGVSCARNTIIDYLEDKVLYILFIDSDDDVDDDYLPKMCEYCADNSHEIVESSFMINNNPAQYDPHVVRCGAAGSAIQTRIIGKKRFEDDLQIGEDTNFMFAVCDLTKYRKRHCNSKYIYQLGINSDSLTMRYQNGKIGKTRC